MTSALTYLLSHLAGLARNFNKTMGTVSTLSPTVLTCWAVLAPSYMPSVFGGTKGLVPKILWFSP